MNSINSFTPAEIISLQQGQPVTTSLKVAELFGKRHDDVLKKIRNLECSSDFHLRNFAEMSQEVEIGNGAKRSSRFYEMTKDGFIFVVMGFTGAKAAATKEAYINAFNWMAEQLAAQRSQPAISLTDDELCTLTWCWRAADRMIEAARSIYPLLEVAEHRDAGRYYSIIHEYPRTLQSAQQLLADKTRHIQPSIHGKLDWNRVIPHLRSLPLTKSW
ncbi:phage regulatory protein, Rha family [Aeromonas encheleia]|uniref:Rha family transcriptional regulator n=1 Tax=Aeromonas encheleia TaxID=73010 RepID=UPI0005B2248D|nr:Rha family transcriptional regulator [Aeromonas encheleia]VEG97093.1 phage regulatory protein, Rha family [Aeromonas encheleia]